MVFRAVLLTQKGLLQCPHFGRAPIRSVFDSLIVFISNRVEQGHQLRTIVLLFTCFLVYIKYVTRFILLLLKHFTQKIDSSVVNFGNPVRRSREIIEQEK